MHEKAVKARELKGADLHKYMESKGITHICPSCGDDHVAIMSHGPGKPLHIFAMPRVHPEPPENGTVEMVGLACENCGYIRFFAAQNVVEWREATPSQNILRDEKEPPIV